MRLINKLIIAGTLIATMSIAHAANQISSTNPIVEFDTSLGNFEVQLNPQAAPKTVANFLSYVDSGFYNGTIFHRVIPNFMIQGGGFTKKMQEKPTRPPIVNEANNGLHNTIGTIAMARTNDPNSASAQFFINTVDNSSSLDYTGLDNPGYAVFGKVVEGMSTVMKISAVPTKSVETYENVPKIPVVIEKAFVVSPKTKAA
ncbi:MAG: peptidylprolyl isomerase [Gammaproteobacteria bacterium]|nr:peptidylprolyl isomerase [Gammaproteobacteria bacterium]